MNTSLRDVLSMISDNINILVAALLDLPLWCWLLAFVAALILERVLKYGQVRLWKRREAEHERNQANQSKDRQTR